jgi:hypothetical protein
MKCFEDGRQAMAEVFMPNRKTFNDRDKYDHSSHSTLNSEKGDLAPTPDAEPEVGLPLHERRVGLDSGSGPSHAGRRRGATRRG